MVVLIHVHSPPAVLRGSGSPDSVGKFGHGGYDVLQGMTQSAVGVVYLQCPIIPRLFPVTTNR